MPSLPITAVIPRKQYTAVLNQTVFNIPFIFFAVTDITVYYTPVGTTPNDATQLILQPGAYTVQQNAVTFVGTITLAAPAAAGDIVTIVRSMPYQRLNFYIPGFGNFTPDAVNTDFSSEVLMIQQEIMFNQTVTPRYNLTAAPVVPTDTILPILGANQLWAKNAANTGFIAIDIPAGSAVLPTVPATIAVFTDAIGTIQSSPCSIDNLGNITGVTSITIGVQNYTAANIVRSITGTAANISVTGTVTPTLNLVATAVAAGTYAFPTSVTVDAFGRLTAIVAGGGGGGPIVSVTGTANQIAITAGANPIVSLPNAVIMPGTLTLNADPAQPLQAATKQYVDALAAGLTFKDACFAATTGALNAAYLNGVAGVGATLTNAGALAAFSTDGQNPALNARILVKNQAAPAQNGIYTLTTVGTGAVAWVLTRAADFNTPAEINPGDFILVQNGATLASTAWIQGSTVAVIGTDAITFSQLIIAGGVTNVGGTAGNISSTGGTTPVINLIATGVGAAAYTYANITIDIYGRITAAASGAAPVTAVTGTANQTTSSGGTTPAIGLANNPVLPGTAGTTLPSGNTAARAGGAGTLRFNNQTNVLEATLDGATWVTIDTSGGTVTSVATGTGLTGGPITAAGTINVILNSFAQGRLTLTTNTAVTTADVTAATNIYFTPYKGNYITLYTAGAWKLYQFTQVTLAVPNAASQMYDIFLYDNAGTLTLEAVAWTNDTTRATVLAIQDGVYCKTAALDRRYLGSFRTTTVAGQTEDSLIKRYVWNYYNRVERALTMTTATGSWTYATATWRQANASTANQIDTVVGVAEDRINVTLNCQVANTNGGTGSSVGLGLSSTTVNSANIFQGYNSTANVINEVTAIYSAIPTVGRTYYAWLEYAAAGTATYYATAANINSAGITGSLLM
jgi:hypothetical protein